ncbi:MAG: 50S ribosomal protein L29 [Candidatus Micrarchaeota archaeon]
MAIVKKQALKEMGDADLKAKLSEIESELRMQQGALHNTGKPQSTGRLRALKKLRARILTFLSQREKKANALKADSKKK